jgi:hypothetical protein
MLLLHRGAPFPHGIRLSSCRSTLTVVALHETASASRLTHQPIPLVASILSAQDMSLSILQLSIHHTSKRIVAEARSVSLVALEFRLLSDPAQATANFKPTGSVTSHMADVIVKAAVKDALSDMNVSADFYDALDEEVQAVLDAASRRAQANDRKTVQARDL